MSNAKKIKNLRLLIKLQNDRRDSEFANSIRDQINVDLLKEQQKPTIDAIEQSNQAQLKALTMQMEKLTNAVEVGKKAIEAVPVDDPDDPDDSDPDVAPDDPLKIEELDENGDVIKENKNLKDNKGILIDYDLLLQNSTFEEKWYNINKNDIQPISNNGDSGEISITAEAIKQYLDNTSNGAIEVELGVTKFDFYPKNKKMVIKESAAKFRDDQGVEKNEFIMRNGLFTLIFNSAGKLNQYAKKGGFLDGKNISIFEQRDFETFYALHHSIIPPENPSKKLINVKKLEDLHKKFNEDPSGKGKNKMDGSGIRPSLQIKDKSRKPQAMSIIKEKPRAIMMQSGANVKILDYDDLLRRMKILEASIKAGLDSKSADNELAGVANVLFKHNKISSAKHKSIYKLIGLA